MHSTPPRKPRSSLEVLDRLLESASAPRDLTIVSPESSPTRIGGKVQRPQTPDSPETPLDIPDEDFGEPSPPGDNSLDTVWEAVLSAKSKDLAASPSKVKSLDETIVAEPPPKKKVPKRKSRVDIKESLDGKNLTVTFDLAGVKKQDMHVSFRATRLIVSWKVERVAEKREGNAVVRDREVRKYSHTIPLPEGTKFEDVRASRDGQRLKLTIPNSKCIRADSPTDGMDTGVVSEEQPTDPRTIPDADTILSGEWQTAFEEWKTGLSSVVTEFYSCVAAS
ncbi:hypothetical protein GY45DRAFT_1356178 [Cubamyces sp. BRFM 1775]|nr:hypothetical protein GY45DRAFT_1356178 [Cubamyces sp. BRFM 1775]